MQRSPEKGSIYASVTVDRGPRFGIGVSLLRDGRKVTWARTGYAGEYEFVDVEPGKYEVVFSYGEFIASRQQVEVTAGDHFVYARAELSVTAFPRIPECV
jgi:hypothetical protein